MEKGNTADRVRRLCEPLCEELGLFLWDVRYEKEGSLMYLRVFIDKDGGVGIDDCENLTRPLNKVLDDTDPIKESYVLEVGSPGLGRELRRPEHFEVCIGDEVRLRTIRPVDGVRDFVGLLVGYENNTVELAQNENVNDNLKFRLADCAYVKLNDDADLFN